MMSACVTMEVQKFMRKLHEINPLRRGSMYLALQVKFQVLERLWNFYWTKGEFWSNLSQSKLGILYIFPELFNFLIFFFFFSAVGVKCFTVILDVKLQSSWLPDCAPVVAIWGSSGGWWYSSTWSFSLPSRALCHMLSLRCKLELHPFWSEACLHMLSWK